MTAPPHICTFCGYRTEPVWSDGREYHYRCPNCGQLGTETR